jgi:predicted transposase YbfD/YdcC
MPSAPKKTCQLIVDSGNHYLGALKGNQGNLLKDVETHFSQQQVHIDISEGHGRWEKRVVSRCHQLEILNLGRDSKHLSA